MEFQILGWLVYWLVGAFAGVLAGLLGVGGGIIVVPALIWLLPSAGIGDAHLMQTALGSSLAAIVLTSYRSMRAHHARGAVQWQTARWLSAGVIIGGLLSGWIAGLLPSNTLLWLFALFALVIAVKIFIQRPVSVVRLPSPRIWPVWGLGIGTLSGLVGIGGGSLTVPLLLHYGVATVNAVATSAAVGFPIAISGTIAYVAAGWSETTHAHALGFVYWPAVIGIAMTSWFTAPLGVKLAHYWPAARLKKIFAFFLVAVSLRLLWRAWFA